MLRRVRSFKDIYDTVDAMKGTMSRIARIRSDVRDAKPRRLDCDRLELERPVYRKAKIFTTEPAGHCVNLPEWHYPVVFDVPTRNSHYGNFNGR